jgi:mannose-6-phosphate isomerase-like protein (cupin superfamily)
VVSHIHQAQETITSGSPGSPGARGAAVRPVTAFAVQPGEGTALETPTGDVVTIKADTGQTNGSLTVLELVISPNRGPALHTHLREDELWYVIEGDFRFKAGDAMLRASAGGLAFGPRGTPHCFQNIGDTPGRLLVISTPSGLERFFEQFAALLPGPVGPEAVATVSHANWVEFVGPPLGISDPP